MCPGRAEVEALQKRDMEKYGNPDGPTFDQLFSKEQGKAAGNREQAFKNIIDSSVRTDEETNKKMGATSAREQIAQVSFVSCCLVVVRPWE
jgi:hypothetical protein